MTTETTTALALPTGQALTALFQTAEAVDPIIARIRAEVMSQAPDLTTDKGRKAIASLAYKVSTSKTALDAAGETLIEDARKQVDVVNAARKKIRDKLDKLRDEVRKPLTDWEAAEDARVQRIKDTLAALRTHGLTGEETSGQVKERADDIKLIEITDDFGEYLDQANAAREATLSTLRGMYAAAKKREDQEAELDKLRAEAAARDEADRVKREAEELAQQQAMERECAEADRIAAEEYEAERQARIVRDREEAATRAAEEATRAAEAKAEAERIASEKREADLKRQVSEAAQAERDRLAAEQKAADDARAKREADTKHRTRIRNEIAAALAVIAADNWFTLADALMDGKVPHTEVSL